MLWLDSELKLDSHQWARSETVRPRLILRVFTLGGTVQSQTVSSDCSPDPSQSDEDCDCTVAVV